MERYSKYIDNKNRLFIVLGINSHKVGDTWKNKSIDLLNVNAETVNEVGIDSMENYIKHKVLIKVEKTP